MADLQLLADVAEFKMKFYPRTWARYDLAKPGTMILVPEGVVLKAVETDYRAMAAMIFGDIPEFEEIMKALQELQDEING